MQRESIDDSFALTAVLDVLEDAFDTLNASEYSVAVREAQELTERSRWLDRAGAILSAATTRLF